MHAGPDLLVHQLYDDRLDDGRRADHRQRHQQRNSGHPPVGREDGLHERRPAVPDLLQQHDLPVLH